MVMLRRKPFLMKEETERDYYFDTLIPGVHMTWFPDLDESRKKC